MKLRLSLSKFVYGSIEELCYDVSLNGSKNRGRKRSHGLGHKLIIIS